MSCKNLVGFKKTIILNNKLQLIRSSNKFSNKPQKQELQELYIVVQIASCIYAQSALIMHERNNQSYNSFEYYQSYNSSNLKRKISVHSISIKREMTQKSPNKIYGRDQEAMKCLDPLKDILLNHDEINLQKFPISNIVTFIQETHKNCKQQAFTIQ